MLRILAAARQHLAGRLFSGLLYLLVTRTAGLAALLASLLLALPTSAQAAGCSAYMGQATVNELRIGYSGRLSSSNQIEIYNSGGVAPAVWSTWKLVVYQKQGNKAAVLMGSYPLSTGITAAGLYLYNTKAVYLRNRNGYAVDVALVDASGDFIDVVALESAIQAVPSCFGTMPPVSATSSKDTLGNVSRTTDGGTLPAAVRNTGLHTIGVSNNCTASGVDVAVSNDPDVSAPIVISTTVTYTVEVRNMSCTGSVSNLVLTDTGVSDTNFSSLSNTVSQGSAVQGASSLVWSIGSLVAGASATLIIVGNPRSLGNLTTTAAITGAGSTLVNTGNDSAAATITVRDFNYVGFNLASATVTEGLDSSYSATLSSGLVATSKITIAYSVTGTAGPADTDLPASGTVVIDPASVDLPSSTSIYFVIKNDSLYEPTKSIVLTITSVTSTDATVKLDTSAQAMTITLLDDDPALHHLEIRHASGNGLTCAADALTLAACSDAGCSTLYTGGMTGTLAAAGSGMVMNWPSGTAFSIPAGSGTVSWPLQQSTAGSTLLSASGLSPSPGNATTCNFGSPSCTWSAVDAGFLFDVPNHVSEVAQTVAISAVKKADNSLACVPAFASTSKAVTFSCSYSNPSSGTLPVRVGGIALNSGNSSAAACDAGGRAVTLAFNTSGVASTTVQYADVGQISLDARYAGTAGTSEAGLVMTGSDSFIAAPHSLAFSGITAGPIKAGNSFAATVSARNAALATTPNFGREAPPEAMSIGFVRLQPGGSGAADGSFSGSLGTISAGTASASNLAWAEVGRGDLVARLASGSYLGTGLTAFGASPATGALVCAAENGSCSLPGGVTATVYYGANSSYFARAGQTGSVSCSNGVFGDPLPGTGKACYYVATATTTGSVGDFIPHHFNVVSTAACGAFSYAGQPFATTVTAVTAAGNTTRNFDGTVLTSPNFAQAVTLSDALPLALGTMAGNSIAASAFSAGVASAAPSYSFTTKATAPQTLAVRAANAGAGAAAIGSAGFTEGSMALKSGRLRLSNAFGSAKAVLQIPVVAEHWSGNAWVLNSADNCSALAAGSVALSNPRSAAGSSSTASSSVTGALALVNGSGLITLAAPTPAGSSLSLDVAVNLGSTSTDQSCQPSHPTSLGAAKPWLRAQNGSCAVTADRDPAARASFGIFSPESKKTVHVRELF